MGFSTLDNLSPLSESIFSKPSFAPNPSLETFSSNPLFQIRFLFRIRLFLQISQLIPFPNPSFRHRRFCFESFSRIVFQISNCLPFLFSPPPKYVVLVIRLTAAALPSSSPPPPPPSSPLHRTRYTRYTR